MSSFAAPFELARQTRRHWADHVTRGLPAAGQALALWAQHQIDSPALTRAMAQERRDMVHALARHLDGWQRLVADRLPRTMSRAAGLPAAPPEAARPPAPPPPGAGAGHGRWMPRPAAVAQPSAEPPRAPGEMSLSLVDDETIERGILASRLGAAVADFASWELVDLRARLAFLEEVETLAETDLLLPQPLGRLFTDAWVDAGLALKFWRLGAPSLHEQIAFACLGACQEANRRLLAAGVMPEVRLHGRKIESPNLVAAAQRAALAGGSAGQAAQGPQGAPGGHGGHRDQAGQGGYGGYGSYGGYGDPGSAGRPGGYGNPAAPAPYSPPYSPPYPPPSPPSPAPSLAAPVPAPAPSPRVAAGVPPVAPAPAGAAPRDSWTGYAASTLPAAAQPTVMQPSAEALTQRLGQFVTQHLPTFAAPTRTWHVSPELATVMEATQRALAERAGAPVASREAGTATQTALLEELGSRKHQLKRAATSQEERATIEIVDLLFQAILAEDRIPASVRVLFARLQMPVLRVAISEPDFFAAADHPARRLIDRMGACAMGFDRMAGELGDALGREIRRVVQVVEAYPDTGRRVFQSVLNEFEKFIETFMREQSDAARTAVSLAEQVEQRETLAIQYTIELRRMLDTLPVHEGVRDFLFQVWADVLALTSLRHGAQSAQIQAMRRVASELIWAAGAKSTREERADVIRRLPQLLKSVREGMASASLDVAAQDLHIRELNNALAAAFTAKSAAISRERVAELARRLETLDELLPDSAELQAEDAMMLDLSDQESAGLEVASEPGAAAPSAPALARARALQVGSWHQLEFRGRSEAVQLVWQGMRRQLALFASAGGRCVLFPLRELANHLERQALRPVEEEPLTARATRNVLARLDANPGLIVS